MFNKTLIYSLPLFLIPAVVYPVLDTGREYLSFYYLIEGSGSFFRYFQFYRQLVVFKCFYRFLDSGFRRNDVIK